MTNNDKIQIPNSKLMLGYSLMDVIVLTLSIVSGQLVKLSFGTQGGLTLLDLAVAAFCILGLYRIKLKFLKPPLWIKVAFVFSFVAFASLIFTPINLSQFEYFISFSYLFRFFIYILFGWLIFSNVFPNIRENTYPILLISGLTLAVLGLLQLLILPDLRFLAQFGWDPHYFRTASTFLDPNFLGCFLVLTLAILYQNFLIQKKRVNMKWFFLIGAAVYIALLTTFSRGSYLAFLAAFLTLSLLDRSIRLVFITILLFTGLMAGFLFYERLVAIPRNIDRIQSAEFRLCTWQQGIKLFQLHPMLGVGFNTYRYALREYNLGDRQFLQSRGSSTNDSSLLYVATTTGMLGLLTFIFFVISLILVGLKGKILVAELSAIFIQSFFANTFFYPHLLIWVILIAASHKK